MVKIFFEPLFEKRVKRIKDILLKTKIKKQMLKIAKSPEIGKPMKYTRKNTREIYIAPFRLSYQYIEEEDKIIFSDIYHKDEQ